MVEGDHNVITELSLRTLAEQHLWLPYSPPGRQGPQGAPIRVFTRAQGCTLWDSSGRSYIDGISALEAMILGQGDDELIRVMSEQASELVFIDVFRAAAPAQIELAADLIAVAPSMQYVYFSPGGAEADEAAIKIARQYHYLRGEPYRKKVVTRQGAFHGVTHGAMALDGGYFASRNVIYDGGITWGRTAPSPACGRCDFGKASRHLACPHNIEAVIRAEGAETVAAVVVDPMATSIGVATPPDSYLRDLYAVCKRYGVLLIVDEVITGMGRTGRMFCTEYSGIEPDMITMSKGLTSGYFPLAATLVAGHVADAFQARPDGALLSGHTYSGHPIGAAVARAVLHRVIAERLWEQAESRGHRLLEGLRGLKDHRHFWDVRGRGLLIGLEIVADHETGRDFSDPVVAGNELRMLCLERGLVSLILHPGNVLFVAPPLVITEGEIDRIIEIVGDALNAMTSG